MSSGDRGSATVLRVGTAYLRDVHRGDGRHYGTREYLLARLGRVSAVGLQPLLERHRLGVGFHAENRRVSSYDEKRVHFRVLETMGRCRQRWGAQSIALAATQVDVEMLRSESVPRSPHGSYRCCLLRTWLPPRYG